MPNIAKVLKEEIARIARKEMTAATGTIRKSSVAAKHDIASLKRQMGELVKAGKEMQAGIAKLTAAMPVPAQPEAEVKARITAKGMRSLRKRLGLTGADFAKLLGVTNQAVYNWEQSSGAIRVRESTRKAVLAVRDIGAKEAKKRLAEMAAKAQAKKKPVRKVKTVKSKKIKPARKVSKAQNVKQGKRAKGRK